MSDTKIFFTVRRDNPDDEPVVVAQIYAVSERDINDYTVTEHVMTIEGARTRMHDFEAAITDAERQRASQRVLAGAVDTSKTGWLEEAYRPPTCRTCGSTSHTIEDCPEEVLVYAVKVDGEDYQLVAHDLEELRDKIGTVESFGQCKDCGSYGPDGEPVGYFMLGQTTGDNTPVYAVCQGCQRKRLVVLKPSKEVCF